MEYAEGPAIVSAMAIASNIGTKRGCLIIKGLCLLHFEKDFAGSWRFFYFLHRVLDFFCAIDLCC